MSTTTGFGKALRRPDTFTQGTRKFFDTLNKNVWPAVVVLGILLVAGLGSAIYMKQQGARAEEGRGALFEAELALSTRMTELTPKPKTTTDKAKKEPAQAEPAPAYQYKKLDVDQTFSAALAKFRQVARDYEGTRPAFEAQLAIGDLYFKHEQPAKAVEPYKAAAESAPNDLERALAYYSLGYAYADSGKAKEAVEAYDRVLKLEDLGLKTDVLLAKARAYTQAGKKDEAVKVYDQLVSQFPNTDAARTAAILKEELK